jgi:hypothetical protein
MLGLIQTKYVGILHGTYPNTHVYRVDKDAQITKIVNKTLQCPVTSVTTVTTETHTSSKCSYTKDLNVLTSSQYAKKNQCLKETIPKGINC